MEEIDRVMRTPDAFRWIKDALSNALARAPVTADNDAQWLLDARCACVLAPGKDLHGCP